MKIKFLALSALLGSALFVSSLANAEVASMPVIDKGRILNVEGTVEIKEPGDAFWKAPKKGAWIQTGSQIKTGPGSSCDIALGEGRSILQMKENSQTKLSAIDASLIQVNLELGGVFAKVRGLKKDSTFKVSSPTAIASARGTGWEQSMDEINVFENSVEVVGADGEMLTVGEGFGVDIDATGDIKEPEPVSNEDKAAYDNFETQAEQLAVEEAVQPADAGEGEADRPSGDEKSQDTPDTPAADFDSFGEGFGGEELENPSEVGGESSGEDVLGEAKEEQQESDTTDDSQDDGSGCVPNVSNGYSCP